MGPTSFSVVASAKVRSSSDSIRKRFTHEAESVLVGGSCRSIDARTANARRADNGGRYLRARGWIARWLNMQTSMIPKL
jgi:hypothetical protein